MITRTRYFVIASLLVMVVGVGTGLVAYYAGFPGVLAGQPGVEDLRFLPRAARLVAYANVREVMDSEFRQKVRNALPMSGDGQREFAERTGINVETDIDRVLACLAPSQAGQQMPAAVLVIARGRFDTARIEALMREQGARVDEYKGTRIIVAGQGLKPSPSESFAVAFIEPGIAALGSTSLVQTAVDQKSGAAGVTENAELMGQLRSLTAGDAWAVGQFDELASQAHLPDGLARQLPPITWFATNLQVDGGLRGMFRADTRDQQAADNLREVVRGFIALGRMQVASQPSLKGFLDSLALGGTGTTVSLSFDAPAQLVDVLGLAGGIRQSKPEPSGK